MKARLNNLRRLHPKGARWIAALTLTLIIAAPLLGVVLGAVRTRHAGAMSNVRIEHFTGEKARTYFESLLARNPQMRAAYDRAVADLRQRGFKPSGTLHVERRYHVTPGHTGFLDRLVALLEPVLHAQNYFDETNGDGEFVMDGWGSGDPRYWVGTIYCRRFSDGKWIMGDWEHGYGSRLFREC